MRGVKVLRVGWLYVSAPKCGLPALIGRCIEVTTGRDFNNEEQPALKLGDLMYENRPTRAKGGGQTFMARALEHVH